jgi:DnaK suppressor protein
MAKSKLQKKDDASANGHLPADENRETLAPVSAVSSTPKDNGDEKLSPFLRKQKLKLLFLRDSLLDAMMGVSRDTLRARAEGSEASAFGMHQADAGSDAYDRDFALSLLSQEQDALYEIEEALKRVEAGTYGVCEMSGKAIPHARLEAIPFARFTVECQAQLEKQKKATRIRQPVTSLFGLTDEEGGEGEEEESTPEAKD